METTTTLSKTEKPNSFEFGKAGNRFKLFFDTAEELKALMDNLIKQDIYAEEE